jgi:sugar phosphate isomerase/epimerase
VSGVEGFGAEALKRVVDAGFRLVELSFNRSQQGVRYDDRDLARRLGEEAEKLGVTFTAHAPDRYWLSNPDREELNETVRSVCPVVEGAGAYGVKVLVIHCCPGKTLVTGREKEQMEGLVWALEALAPVCEEHGVCLAAETMIPGRLTSSVENLIEAVDRVNSPWVRICLDTNHTNLSQYVNQAVRAGGRRIAEFHLNDNHFVEEEHLLPYEGAIDWPAFAQAAVDIDTRGFMVMEPGGHYTDEADLLVRARKAADRLLADLTDRADHSSQHHK